MLIKKLEKKDLLKIVRWSIHESIKKWIHIGDWHEYYAWAGSMFNYKLFGIWNNKILIGEMSVEINEEIADISIIIRPEFQRCGYGTNALLMFSNNISSYIDENLCAITASIEPNNIGSIKCFIKAGFIENGIGKDDNLLYIKNL